MAGKNDKEDICRQCGRCCCAKLILDDNEIVYLPYPCPYLDEHTRRCTVYEHRHAVNPNCLTLDEGIRLGVFPADCPYVADLNGYRPPREHWTQQDLELYSEWGGEDDADGHRNTRRKF